MADFKTHLMGATLVSGVAATGLAMTGIASNQAVVGYFTLGVAGGLMPDIDSETSIPIRIAYQVLSVLAALMLVFTFADRYSLLELVVLALAGYLIVRYVIFFLFSYFTVHRGLVHSIPAAVIFAQVTAIVTYQFFDATTLHAWFCALFMLIGFLVHLALDEMYSIDLLGRSFKRSFGTALTFFDKKNWLGTAALYVIVAVLFYVGPALNSFSTFILDGDTYTTFAQRILPQGAWFAGLFSH